MKRLLFAAAIAAIAAGSTAGIDVASAQPAAALGHPLPDGSMDAGSISVRVVAGSPASPVIGADVTLVVGDQPRTARTDASGRAMFPGLTAGAMVQAKVKDAEGKDIVSDAFPVPSSGGARVMLSTKPFTGGAGPAMQGGGGMPAPQNGKMPEPRQMSGQPRQDRDTPPGTIVVRATYNDLVMVDGKPKDPNPPVGETVTLVGYASDNSVSVQSVKVDANGHATFEELDVTGATGYFTLVNLPRGAGVDRLFSLPAQLDGQAGMRVILSGEKRDAAAPNIDQLATQHALSTPPGKVRVTLEGFPTANAPIRVIDAATQKVVASGNAAVMQGDPSTVQGGSKFEAKPDLPANTLDVYVHGGAKTDAPLADIELRVIPADAKSLDGGIAAKTAADGTVRITVPAATPPAQVRAAFRVLGRDFASEPFDLSKAGGRLDVRAQWADEGRPQGLFDIQATPGQVLYAEAIVDGKLAGTYRSMPFSPVASTGTHVGVIVYPRVMFKFNMRALIEDELLGVQGRWTIENNSWIPYQASPDGMLIPLPAGFKGGVVAEMNQNDVAVVPGEGLRVMRPLPPGSGVSFIAGFSLGVDSGTVEWKLDLPLGTFNSDLHIRQSPNMTVVLPEGVKGEMKPGKDGSPYFMVEQITIPKGKSMTLRVDGLPSQAAWKIWAPRVIGILVIMVILGGIGIAIASRSATKLAPGSAMRRAALLDELVMLERTGRDPHRKEQVLNELEKLWGA